MIILVFYGANWSGFNVHSMHFYEWEIIFNSSPPVLLTEQQLEILEFWRTLFLVTMDFLSFYSLSCKSTTSSCLAIILLANYWNYFNSSDLLDIFKLNQTTYMVINMIMTSSINDWSSGDNSSGYNSQNGKAHNGLRIKQNA